jgi:hypothetical protein
MTAAQKAAKEKFSKAIAYRSKTGVSLKEAFAHVYGKKVNAVKKKAAPKKKLAVKKAAPKKKASAKKKIGNNSDKILIEFNPKIKTWNVYEGNDFQGTWGTLTEAKNWVRAYFGQDADKIDKTGYVPKSKKVGVIKKYTKKQLEKIASDYAYVTGADFDKVTYRLLDKDYTEKLLPVYLKAIEDYKKQYNVKVLGIKKPVTKKPASKKITGSHKDTKSHNVNIRVVSGISKVSSELINELKGANEKLIKWQKVLTLLNIEKTKVPTGLKAVVAMDIKRVKDAIKEQKTHIQELKKNIK